MEYRDEGEVSSYEVQVCYVRWLSHSALWNSSRTTAKLDSQPASLTALPPTFESDELLHEIQ